MGVEQKPQVRHHWPFIRAPLRLQHLIPFVGLYLYGREERRLMNQAPDDTEVILKSKNPLTGPMTLWVNTWPKPQNSAEWKAYVITQAVHGGMLAYHFLWGWELVKQLFTARSQK